MMSKSLMLAAVRGVHGLAGRFRSSSGGTTTGYLLNVLIVSMIVLLGVGIGSTLTLFAGSPKTSRKALETTASWTTGRVGESGGVITQQWGMSTTNGKGTGAWVATWPVKLAVSKEIPEKSLALFYKFEELVLGKSLPDDSGHQHMGMLVGFSAPASSLVEGRMGKGLKFDRGSMVVAYPPPGFSSSGLGLSVWFKSEGEGEFSSSGLTTLVAWGGAYGETLTLGLEKGIAKWIFQSGVGEVAEVKAGEKKARSLADGKWHHLVGTWDGSSGTGG